MKKEVFGIVIGISLLSFVSAYGSYSFSLGNFFNTVDSSTMILGTLFIIFFALINFALANFFRSRNANQNGFLSAVISFSASLLIVYSLHRSNLNIESFFYNIGFSEELLGTIIPIILVLGIIFLIWRLKIHSLLILGILFFMIGTFTDLLYEKGTIIWMGIGLSILWIIMFVLRRRKRMTNRGHMNIGPYFPTQAIR